MTNAIELTEEVKQSINGLNELIRDLEWTPNVNALVVLERLKAIARNLPNPVKEEPEVAKDVVPTEPQEVEVPTEDQPTTQTDDLSHEKTDAPTESVDTIPEDQRAQEQQEVEPEQQ